MLEPNSSTYKHTNHPQGFSYTLVFPGIQSPFNLGKIFLVFILETALPFHNSHGLGRSASGGRSGPQPAC